MIYAKPGQEFTALLENAETGLVGTLATRIDTTGGATKGTRSKSGIAEAPHAPGNYLLSRIAPNEAGRFLLIWDKDADGLELDPSDVAIEELIVTAALPAPTDWRPEVAEVASTWLRARTYVEGEGDEAGDEAGTFTANTRPTAVQAEDAIDQAVWHVLSHFTSSVVPEGSYIPARRAATVYAAYLIEIGYLPEQAEDNSAFLQLRQQADAALTTLITHAQLRDMFGETQPEEEE